MKTTTRLLLALTLILCALQTAVADKKNKSTKSTTDAPHQAIEINDYGFGVSMPVTAGVKGKGPSPTNSKSLNSGRPTGRR